MKPQNAEASFWRKVNRSAGPGSCWEWMGRKSRGYGSLTRKTPHGTFIRAHRYAWYLANGPIPDGMVICHKCDNPGCVNPAHLFIGTQDQNNKDRAAKGRTVVLTGDDWRIKRRKAA